MSERTPDLETVLHETNESTDLKLLLMETTTTIDNISIRLMKLHLIKQKTIHLKWELWIIHLKHSTTDKVSLKKQ